MPQPSTISLRETVRGQIGAFLIEENLTGEPLLIDGILEIIDMIADYHEEGKALFPEILITKGKSILETVPDLKVELGEIDLSVLGLRKIVKDCAPLCTSEWVIYIKVCGKRLCYGLTCAEITETTPSLYTQTVSNKVDGMDEYSIAYLRNIGTKTVELSGIRARVVISLTLDDPSEISNNEVNQLAMAICSNINDEIRNISINYFTKILSEGLKAGHGNLIAVVDATQEAIQQCRDNFPDGTYPDIPLNIIDLLRAFESDKSGINSVALRQYSSIIKSMINTDGLTVFSSDGKLLGYHIIVRRDFLTEELKNGINGGARTHTFFNLKESKIFKFGFIKSQDGPEKIFN